MSAPSPSRRAPSLAFAGIPSRITVRPRCWDQSLDHAVQSSVGMLGGEAVRLREHPAITANEKPSNAIPKRTDMGTPLTTDTAATEPRSARGVAGFFGVQCPEEFVGSLDQRGRGQIPIDRHRHTAKDLDGCLML